MTDIQTQAEPAKVTRLCVACYGEFNADTGACQDCNHQAAIAASADQLAALADGADNAAKRLYLVPYSALSPQQQQTVRRILIMSGWTIQTL